MKYSVPLLLGLLVISPAQPKEPLADIDEHQTSGVVNHHWKTFVGNDLEGTLADYTEDSVLITPKRTYKGLNEIRDNFISAFKHFPKDSSKLQLHMTVINRDIGYIIWEGTGPTSRLTFGTDTFVVRHGKIVSQTFGGVSDPP
jgi:hypothetical protein